MLCCISQTVLYGNCTGTSPSGLFIVHSKVWRTQLLTNCPKKVLHAFSTYEGHFTWMQPLRFHFYTFICNTMLQSNGAHRLAQVLKTFNSSIVKDPYSFMITAKKRRNFFWYVLYEVFIASFKFYLQQMLLFLKKRGNNLQCDMIANEKITLKRRMHISSPLMDFPQSVAELLVCSTTVKFKALAMSSTETLKSWSSFGLIV